MKNTFSALFIAFIIYCFVIPASHSIKMANPTIIEDGTVMNNDSSKTVNDKLLNEYENDEPEEKINKEVKINEWEAINDNHNYDSYNAQNYGGEGNDDGECENDDNYPTETYFDD